MAIGEEPTTTDGRVLAKWRDRISDQAPTERHVSSLNHTGLQQDDEQEAPPDLIESETLSGSYGRDLDVVKAVGQQLRLLLDDLNTNPHITSEFEYAKLACLQRIRVTVADCCAHAERQ